MVNFHGMGMPSFEYNGVNVTTTYGIRMTAKPSIPTPQQRAEKFTVGGRDSYLTFTDGTYENITISVPVRIRLLESEAQTKFQDIRDLFMRRNFFYRGADLSFSLYPDWVYEVYEWHPYTWEYFPATGEWFTTFEIECRPYKKSTTTDTLIIDNVGDLQMSPWMNFRAQDRDQFGNYFYEAGAYEAFDGDKLDMFEDFNLVDGFQNSNNLVPRLQSLDGSGIPYKTYDTAPDMTQRNFLNVFYDITTVAMDVFGRWSWAPTISAYSGNTLYCKEHSGVAIARCQQRASEIKKLTGVADAGTLYVNFDSSNPAHVSVSVYEVNIMGQRIKTLVASGKNGGKFSLMNMSNQAGNFIQISIEFSNPTTEAYVSNLRITRTDEAPYVTTYQSYSTSHVKANVIEMSKSLDMFVFNNADTDDAKLTAIQGRAPEIEVYHSTTLPTGYEIASHELSQLSGTGTRHTVNTVSTDKTAGTKTVKINPLKPLTTTMTLKGAVSADNKLHYVTRTSMVGSKTGAASPPMSVLLDEVYVRMRMKVRPTTSRIYDNAGGEEAPMMITITPRGGNATLEWRNAAGGVFEKFTMALPSGQLNSDIIIDTDRKLVYNVATGIPLTQYCYGKFPRCLKGQRMEYRINGDVLKARMEITKRKL